MSAKPDAPKGPSVAAQLVDLASTYRFVVAADGTPFAIPEGSHVALGLDGGRSTPRSTARTSLSGSRPCRSGTSMRSPSRAMPRRTLNASLTALFEATLPFSLK